MRQKGRFIEASSNGVSPPHIDPQGASADP
jgi:hypothetical protein